MGCRLLHAKPPASGRLNQGLINGEKLCLHTPLPYFYQMPLTLSDASLAYLLKHETEALHQQVEASLLPRLQHIRSREEYGRLLRFFYGYFFPVEEAIQQHITPAHLPDIHKRRNAASLLTDLHNLGDDPVPELSRQLPVISNVAQAFGALYVLEGSTLGGRVIAKMLAKNTHYAIPADALHFFNGYGAETGKMWTGFLEALNKQPQGEAVIEAANQTFFYLKNWMHTFYEQPNK